MPACWKAKCSAVHGLLLVASQWQCTVLDRLDRLVPGDGTGNAPLHCKSTSVMTH